MSGVMADVTERRLAEDALLESRERLHFIVENAREYAIFSTTPDLRVTSWSSGAEQILGYSEAEILDRNSDVRFITADRAAGRPQQDSAQARAEPHEDR